MLSSSSNPNPWSTPPLKTYVLICPDAPLRPLRLPRRRQRLCDDTSTALRKRLFSSSSLLNSTDADCAMDLVSVFTTKRLPLL